MDTDVREFYRHSLAPERRGSDDHSYHQQLSPNVSGPVGWFTGQNERHLLTSRVSPPDIRPLHCREAAARPALARGNLFQLGTQDYKRQNDKEDKITNDSDKSLVPVIIAIVISWVLLAIRACMIIIKISGVTPTSGPL